MRQRNKVLILVGRVPKDKDNSLNYGEFKRQLQPRLQNDCEITMAALKEFRYEIGLAGTRVWIPERDIDAKDFDLVVFRLWSNESERAAALVYYLDYLGIDYIDPTAGRQVDSKVAGAMSRWCAGISVPATVFGTPKLLREYMQDPERTINFPCILKSAIGRKGRDNYLIHSSDELKSILEQESNTEFLLQQYIASSGDYRFLVFGRYICNVIHRLGSDTTHLSNTSQGGQAELAVVSEFSQVVRHDVLRAASLEGVETAGVDVIFDSNNEHHYILEVNRSPQLLTGAFTNEKMKSFARFLKRRCNQSTHSVRAIGRRVTVTFPEFHCMCINGKTDTGAYRSSLHAENIKEKVYDGESRLCFTVKDLNNQTTEHYTTHYRRAKVRSSSGEPQMRYVIYTTLIIGGQKYRAALTLNDRATMKHQLLLGRKLLRHNFVVDVAKTEGVF